MREETTSLVNVILMLQVLTYVVSYHVFWIRSCFVRFVSHEVLFDKGFVI